MSERVLRYNGGYKGWYKTWGTDNLRQNNEFASLKFRPVTDERTESGAVATPLFQPFRLSKRPSRAPIRVPSGFPSGQVATAPQKHVPKIVRHGFFINNSGTV